MQAFVTHSVVNQVPTLEDYSLYETDLALQEGVRREGAQLWSAELHEHGVWLGRAQTLALGVEANPNPPRLIAYDRYGHRVDQIAFHSTWHQLMSGILAHGLHSKAWAVRPASRAHVARAAAYLMQGQVEAGTL